ncbi:protein cornichon homolog 4-like [Dioscorea cayenensis subsp. rotundata]|uniref:Protein cornichon homolog 4-like n=1 Tax=Dioscorea cayennensis subsp. rotundata TaxID=55577 RepID=A0AB40BB04_DIOCR|nr:protein cornichon homolog 4-like [Dioscorea cayenensis subsp. rotundata]
MLFVIILWLFVFLLIMALFLLTVYQLMCCADLEMDYTNTYDFASEINSMVLPEFALQGILISCFLFSQNWVLFLLCVPLLYYHFRRYMHRQHIVYATEVFYQLGREKKVRLVKLGYYMFLFFLSSFLMVVKMMNENY